MSRYFRSVAVIGLTCGLIAFFLRNADWVSVLAELRRARFDFIGAALVAMTMSFVVRVKRWQLLLVPLGQIGFEPAASATSIGFAITALLPGRLGEIVRPYLLARREHLGTGAAFATIVIERFLDLLILVFLLGVSLVFLGDVLDREGDLLLAGLEAGGLLAGCVALIGLVSAGVVVRQPHWITVGLAAVHRRLPERTGDAVSGFVVRFVSGFGAVGDPVRLLRALGWSVAVWGFVAVSAWCTCAALGILLPPSGSLLLTVLMAIGVAVPTPGGVGGFHAVVQLGLTSLFSAHIDVSTGAAIVLHVVAFGPVTVAGCIWMVRDGVTLRGAADLASLGKQDL